MGEDASVDKVRRYLDALQAGELESVSDYFSDGVVWRVAGTHPLSGTYRGKDELIGYFQKVRDMTGGTLKIEPESILTGERHMGILTRVSGERDGKTMDVLLAQAFTLDDQGRWSEYWALANDQDAVNAFWS